jgi:hypothetical protein
LHHNPQRPDHRLFEFDLEIADGEDADYAPEPQKLADAKTPNCWKVCMANYP